MMGQTWPNKRRHERFSVALLGINGKLLLADEVKIHDVSVSGLALEADRRLNMGSEYLIRLACGQRVISLKGVVVWSRLVKTRENRKGEVVPIYNCGMQFNAMSADKMGEMVAFIRDCTKNRSAEPEMQVMSGLRCNIRYPVDIPRKAVIEGTEEYKVKKISMGGMLVGAAHEFTVDERFPMELYLPADGSISFTGRIASCLDAREEEAGRYDIGVEFVELNQEGRSALAAFIQEIKDGVHGTSGQ